MFKPLHDYVLIERSEAEEATTTSGLIIPDTARENSSTAVVVAVGPGTYQKGKRIPLHVKPGDKVLLTKFAGQEFTVDDKKVVLIKQENIISVLG